ncbi:Endonuclease/exonuclease/phosphatase [Cyathus striatus]|nr:Endonuclease/exonuclease/phosphatase [Cyathus striatus]
MIWAGDFNRHHPMWDSNEDIRLFTNRAMGQAEQLINLLQEWDMVMTLPKGIHTLQHSAGGYSRPDNVFCSESIADLIIQCDVKHEMKPVKADHFPIVTILLCHWNG